MIQAKSHTLILDASAILDYFADAREHTEPLRTAVEDPAADRHTLTFCDLEFLAGLRSMVLRKALSPHRAELAIELFADFPLTRHDHQPLVPRIWQLRDNFTVYDAGYVALAEATGAPLVTADRRLRSAVRKHTAIEVLP